MATVDDMRYPAPRTDRLPTAGAQPLGIKGRMAKVATKARLAAVPGSPTRRSGRRTRVRRGRERRSESPAAEQRVALPKEDSSLVSAMSDDSRFG